VKYLWSIELYAVIINFCASVGCCIYHSYYAWEIITIITHIFAKLNSNFNLLSLTLIPTPIQARSWISSLISTSTPTSSKNLAISSSLAWTWPSSALACEMSLSLKRNLLIDVKLNGGLFYCVMNCGKRPIVAKGGNSSKHLQSWEGKGGTKILFKNPFHIS